MATDSSKYTLQHVTYVEAWTDHLFSFRTTRDSGFNFIPGQFARLGIIHPDGDEVWRPYSIVSANYDEELEFYSIVVPDGRFTQQLKHLKIGDKIMVDNTNYGLLTTDRFENGKHLWLLSTGTGLAPFISILYDFDIWQQYDNVILVHCARESNELVYQDKINEFFTHEYYSELVTSKLKYVKVLTRDNNCADLYGRITTLLENGSLEKYVGHSINIEDSRVMLCGNPDMVRDIRGILTSDRYALALSRRGKPGNLAVENYW